MISIQHGEPVVARPRGEGNRLAAAVFYVPGGPISAIESVNIERGCWRGGPRL